MSEPITIDEFRVFRDYLRGYCGLYLSDDKYSRVVGVIGARMNTLGIGSFTEYYRLLTCASGSKTELSEIVSSLTVGETHFLRNRDHWRAFRQYVLPWIVERGVATDRREIRVWSAGCSSGEEAYTAAMVIQRNLPDLARWNVHICGTDISPVAIDAARKAVYTANSFRGTPDRFKKEFFEPAGDRCYTPRSDIRKMVEFKMLNLLNEAAMSTMRDFDVILCRNVLIYFDRDSSQRVLTSFHRALRPHAYLFLGHSEAMRGRIPGFACVNICDTFLYQAIPRMADRSWEVVGPSDKAAFELAATPRKLADRSASSRQEKDTPASATAPTMTTAAPAEAAPQGEGLDRSRISTERKALSAEPSDDLRSQIVELLLAEDFAAAQTLLEDLISRNPNDWSSLLLMALTHADMGLCEPALECCHRVLHLQLLCAEAYCVNSLVYESLGNDATALPELEKAIYLDHDFAVAHFRLACLHDRAGRTEDALREYRNALRSLSRDDEQRVRLYSGGFGSEFIAGACERRVGNDAGRKEALVK